MNTPNYLSVLSDFRFYLRILVIKLILLLFPWPLCGNSQPQSRTINPSEQKQIIEWIAENLQQKYLTLDVAENTKSYIRSRMQKNEYDQYKDLADFTRVLTRDMQKISGDAHLKLLLNSDPPPESADSPEWQEWHQRQINSDRMENFYFKQTEHLPGNVGYLRFDKFCDAQYAAPALTAALNLLAHSDALIIDLRFNGGGYENLQQLLLSHFFTEPVHYLTHYTTYTDQTEELHTLADTDGPDMSQTDVYVLTSNDFTFSAAEGLAFALQNQKRGTIIGETSSGGAHFMEFAYLRAYNLELRLPIGRAYDPVTGKDWDGAGVVPDIKVPAAKALDAAHALALEKLMRKSADPSEKQHLKWLWENRAALNAATKIDVNILQNYAGGYGPVDINIYDQALLIRNPDSPEYHKMAAISEYEFAIAGDDRMRCLFEADSSGKIVAILAVSENGDTKRLEKTSPYIDARTAGAYAAGTGTSNDIFTQLNMKFIPVTGGSYNMGDTFSKEINERRPVHQVTLNDYELSTTEITFAQYDCFCIKTGREQPSDAGWGRNDRPVINITWDDAQAFCRWLSEMSGQKIRLPTEAEWEYAAREGGRNVRFGNGQNIADPEQINFNGSPEHRKDFSRSGPNRARTLPVASLQPNALGLYDMSGNVWEWCSDWFADEYYKNCPERNPKGAESGIYRVMRGGSWEDAPAWNQCCTRGAYTPASSENFIGFRVVREVSELK